MLGEVTVLVFSARVDGRDLSSVWKEKQALMGEGSFGTTKRDLPGWRKTAFDWWLPIPKFEE